MAKVVFDLVKKKVKLVAPMKSEELLSPSRVTKISKVEVENSQDVKNFVPIEIQDISSQEVLPFSIFFPFSASEKAIVFKKISEAGGFLNTKWKSLFQEHDIQQAYIRQEELALYLSYLNKRLEKVVQNPYLTAERKNELLYRNASYIMHRILEDPKAGKNIKVGIDFVEILSRYVTTNEVTASIISQIFSKDYALFSHSIQVAFLTVTFCRFLKTDFSFMLHCGIGALLHDVGKVEIPNEVLNKNGSLSKEEFCIIKKHPEYGLRILGTQDSLEREVLDVVYQHHESADGNGYPQGIKLPDISPEAQIVHLVDCYDAMTTSRTYRPCISPFKTLQIMCLEMSPSFNKKLLEQFILFLGY